MSAGRVSRLLYVNSNHSYLATQNAVGVAQARNADLLLITEPHHPAGASFQATGWESISGNRCTILVRRDLRHSPRVTGHPDISATQIGNTCYICTYLSPNEEMSGTLEALRAVINDVGTSVVLAGDFNCRTAHIPGYLTNRRGRYFEEMLQDTGLRIQNTPTPTWSRGHSTGINDYVCSRGVSSVHFEVLQEESHSDHRFISVGVPTDEALPKKKTFYHTNTEELGEHIRSLDITAPSFSSTEEIEEYVGTLTEGLQSCIDKSLAPIAARRPTPSWWNPSLAAIHQCTRLLTRRLKRSRDGLVRLILELIRKAFHMFYRRAIAKSKLEAFRRLTTSSKPWGDAFNRAKQGQRTQMPLLRRQDGTLCDSSRDSIKELLRLKFPRGANKFAIKTEGGVQCPAPVVTAEEVLHHLKNTSTRKSPGPDRICVRSLKALTIYHPRVLPSLFSACLAYGYFPQHWKPGRAVFVLKPGKDPNLGIILDSKLSFRPHLEYIAQKCNSRIPLLQGLARNTYEYSYRARKVMFNGYITSLMMYCSSAFYHRLYLKTYAELLMRVQRRIDIICCRGYHDISFKAAGVIAASPPITSRIIERSICWLLKRRREVSYWAHLPTVEVVEDGDLRINNIPASLTDVKKKFRSATLNRWETVWQGCAKAAWTHQLFPTVRSRLALPAEFVPTFWSTQAMSGHGVFRSYLHSRGRAADNRCPCGLGPETPEHVFWECPRFTPRPMWPDQVLTIHHIEYLAAVTRKLWKVENPQFPL